MRPTISEQLRATRRILNEAVLPQIDNNYSARILEMALSNLEMLETAWANVLPFLRWDNEAALKLLRQLRNEVGSDLASAIDQAESDPSGDSLDASALQARNEALQALVQKTIGACGPEGRRRIHAQLLERTARYPMRPKGAGLANARPENGE